MLPQTDNGGKENGDQERGNRIAESGLLWLTKQEKESLIPQRAKKAASFLIAPEIQRRFFGTLGIDYTEGNARALKVRDSQMNLVVTNDTSPENVELTLSGWALIGVPLDPSIPAESQARGCQIWVSGRLEVDCTSKSVNVFEVVGVGQAWGRMWPTAGRATYLGQRVWDYGIAWKLASPKNAVDRIPPYNLLHYSNGDYWGQR